MQPIWPHFRAYPLQPGIIFIDLASSPLSNEIDRLCNQQLQHFLAWLSDGKVPADSACGQLQAILVEVVGGYHQAHFYYDFIATHARSLVASAVVERLQQAWQEFQGRPELAERSGTNSGQLHEVPVCYSETLGPDLVTIAATLDTTVADVIELHTAPEYYIYTIGFAPNFAYMGDVAAELQQPRLASPRTKVPALSVAIAERQTAIYPLASPGGWHLLGRAVGLPNWRAGDRVKFVAISEQDYQQRTQDRQQHAD